MKWASPGALLLLCFLHHQEGTRALDPSADVDHYGRIDDSHEASDRGVIESYGRIDDTNEAIPKIGDSSDHHQENGTRNYGEPQTAPDTATSPSNEERSVGNLHQEGTLGNKYRSHAWHVNERTAQHHSGDGATERTYSDSHQVPRSTDVDKREQGYMCPPNTMAHYSSMCNRNRDNGTGGTTLDSRTQSNNEKQQNDRNNSTETANIQEQPPAPKISSNGFSLEERNESEEEEAVVKVRAHPVGLLHSLKEQETTNTLRSIDLNSREMDTSTTILVSALSGVAVFVLFLVCCVAGRKAKERREIQESSRRLLQLYCYLYNFNPDDVDVELSAAGGYHVSYIGSLAQGINTKKQLDQKTDDSSSSEGVSRLSLSV